MRNWCQADAAAARVLAQRSAPWELAPGPIAVTDRVVIELDHAIVAVAAAGHARADVAWSPEPLLPLPAWPFADGSSPDTTVGCGLLMDPSLSPTQHLAIHRLTRSLLADESGHRYCIVVVPLPTVPPHAPASVVQQIAHGGYPWPPLEVPLGEGYWPVGLSPDATAVVCVRRNATF